MAKASKLSVSVPFLNLMWTKPLLSGAGPAWISMTSAFTEVRDEFGNAGGTTDRDNLVDVGVVDLRGMKNLFGSSPG